jgi:iron complex outermembrane recepter protein
MIRARGEKMKNISRGLAQVRVARLAKASPEQTIQVFKLNPVVAALLSLPWAGLSYAQTLDEVVVSATRTEQRTFDAPAAIQAVGQEVIREAGPQVNLSESLNRIPGVVVLNRQNYSQDLQLSIRGFGSRSQFGIRGVRLIVDGIPATIPDGQGQGSTISLPSAERIEVLRGPLSQLYGNSAGGVVQVFSANGPKVPMGELDLVFGSNKTRRTSIRTGGESGIVNWMADYSVFSTDGFRAHSEAERKQFNTKWNFALGERTKLSLIANIFDQTRGEDPIGLTRAEFNANPKQTNPIAITQNAGKTVKQNQYGAVIDHRFDEDKKLTARIYSGTREVDSRLTIPLAAQNAVTSAGGVVALDRDYSGIGLQYSQKVKLGGESSLMATLGYDNDTMKEVRKGFINNAGVRGALKRDELDTVKSEDFYAQVNWAINPKWNLIAGARSTTVRFNVSDRFIVTGNPDDSGSVKYSGTNPVVGVTYHLNDNTNLYVNWGRGIETPTFTELAYKVGGTGPNLGLQAARSRHIEAGAKFKIDNNHRIDVALFSINNADELSVNTNVGGRSTFKNVGDTRREGLELAYSGRLTDSLTAYASLTALDARFLDSFVSNGTTIAAGKKLPGTPPTAAYAELAWRPKLTGFWNGLSTAVEMVHRGKLYVNDSNTDSADGATTFNLRAGLQQKVGQWSFRQLLRVDNVANKSYAGSVIVNEGNARFFETAPGRTWMLSATARYDFR